MGASVIRRKLDFFIGELTGCSLHADRGACRARAGIHSEREAEAALLEGLKNTNNRVCKARNRRSVTSVPTVGGRYPHSPTRNRLHYTCCGVGLTNSFTAGTLLVAGNNSLASRLLLLYADKS